MRLNAAFIWKAIENHTGNEEIKRRGELNKNNFRGSQNSKPNRSND